MIINKLNYEEYFIDYLDGKLSPSLESELMLFLDQNPNIKDELEGIQDIVLAGESTVFPYKINLKKKSFLKNGIDNEFEYLCIASLEGILTINEKDTLERIIRENPNKQHQYLTLQKTRLSPDKSTVFPNKSQLKRTSIIPIRYSTLKLSISIAASITLIIGVYSIGRIIVNDGVIDRFSKSNITVSPIPSTNKTVEVIKSKPISVYEKPITKKPEKREPSLANKSEEKARINIEESIPRIIHRIDLKGTTTQESPQREELAQIVAKYNTSRGISLEQLYALKGETNSSTPDSREIGVFEVIQYGVRSFGKFIGRDIKLDANKDNKGNIEKITFESNFVAFSTSFGNNE